MAPDSVCIHRYTFISAGLTQIQFSKALLSRQIQFVTAGK